MTTEGFTITHHSSIHELPTEAWDALTGGNFYLSHRWLRVVEGDSRPPPAYFAAWSGDGSLSGGLPVYRLEEAPGNRLSDPGYVVGDRAGNGGWYPALLGGARIGYSNQILVDAGLPAAGEAGVCRALLDSLARFGADEGFSGSSLLYLNQTGAAQLGDVSGWPLVFSTAEAVLDLTASSFEEYLAGLSRSRRESVRADLRDFSRSGLESRLVRLGEVIPAAAPLAVNVQHKYGHRSSSARQVRFFGDCAAKVGEDALVFGCFDGSRLIGFGLAFEWRDTLYMRSAGFDYDALPRRGEHFMVMYYAPIRYAIERGLARVHFGIESFSGKVRRGCSLRPLRSAARRSRPFSDEDLYRLDDVSRARLRTWDDEFASVLGYLPSQRWTTVSSPEGRTRARRPGGGSGGDSRV